MNKWIAVCGLALTVLASAVTLRTTTVNSGVVASPPWPPSVVASPPWPPSVVASLPR